MQTTLEVQRGAFAQESGRFLQDVQSIVISSSRLQHPIPMFETNRRKLLA